MGASTSAALQRSFATSFRSPSITSTPSARALGRHPQDVQGRPFNRTASHSGQVASAGAGPWPVLPASVRFVARVLTSSVPPNIIVGEAVLEDPAGMIKNECFGLARSWPKHPPHHLKIRPMLFVGRASTRHATSGQSHPSVSTPQFDTTSTARSRVGSGCCPVPPPAWRRLCARQQHRSARTRHECGASAERPAQRRRCADGQTGDANGSPRRRPATVYRRVRRAGVPRSRLARLRCRQGQAASEQRFGQKPDTRPRSARRAGGHSTMTSNALPRPRPSPRHGVAVSPMTIVSGYTARIARYVHAAMWCASSTTMTSASGISHGTGSDCPCVECGHALRPGPVRLAGQESQLG